MNPMEKMIRAVEEYVQSQKIEAGRMHEVRLALRSHNDEIYVEKLEVLMVDWSTGKAFVRQGIYGTNCIREDAKEGGK